MLFVTYFLKKSSFCGKFIFLECYPRLDREFHTRLFKFSIFDSEIIKKMSYTLEVLDI